MWIRRDRWLSDMQWFGWFTVKDSLYTSTSVSIRYCLVIGVCDDLYEKCSLHGNIQRWVWLVIHITFHRTEEEDWHIDLPGMEKVISDLKSFLVHIAQWVLCSWWVYVVCQILSARYCNACEWLLRCDLRVCRQDRDNLYRTCSTAQVVSLSNW